MLNNNAWFDKNIQQLLKAFIAKSVTFDSKQIKTGHAVVNTTFSTQRNLTYVPRVSASAQYACDRYLCSFLNHPILIISVIL